MTDEKPIWQRLEGETDKAFEAFCVYRDFGADRSLEKTRQRLGKEAAGYKRVLERWSSENNWVKRAAAYDEWIADEHSRERIRRQKKVESNAWKDYETIRKGITKCVELFEKAEWLPDTEAIRNLLKLMKEADDLARRAVSLPDKITENKTDMTSNGKEVGTADTMAAALLIAQQQLKDWNPDGSGKN